MGYVEVKVKDKNNVIKKLNMYIVRYDRKPLLGREWINQLQILNKLKESLEEIQSLNLIEKTYDDRLKNLLGKYAQLKSEEFTPIKGIRAHLNLKADAQPVFLRSRQVPFQMRDRVENELDD